MSPYNITEEPIDWDREKLLDIQREDRADRIAADKKNEEPITRESIQEIITRQDEDLRNLEGRVFDPVEVKAPMHKVRYRSLQLQIQEIEKDLFRKKHQLESLRLPTHMLGKIVIPAPSPYNCKTCENSRCLHYHGKKSPNIIAKTVRALTEDNGCLAWLPPKEVP